MALWHRHRGGSCTAASLLYTATLLVFVGINVNVCVSGTSTRSPQIFKVLAGPWSECRPVNETPACYKSREVVCLRKTDNATAPWYYCTDNGLDRPHTVARCPENLCAQDCAVSEWSSWSSCNNCSASFFRYRTRKIVFPPRNGGQKCPVLMQREKCSECYLEPNRPFESLPRIYTWRTGEWRECVPFDNTDNCGHGFQTRALDCIDTEGNVVNSTFCLYQEGAYFQVFPPTTTRLCHVHCLCQYGSWSLWSECQRNCSSSILSGLRTRTRTVEHLPTNGERCTETEEMESCSGTSYPNSCPRYSWETSDWSTVCIPQDDEASCGVGTIKRYAYCVRTLDGVSLAVDSSFCNSSARPALRSSCEIPCYQDCIVGEWSDWSDCNRTYVPTYRNRTRTVILPSLAGGAACPHLMEYKACPMSTRYFWEFGEFGTCFPQNQNVCGVGERSANIFCFDIERDVAVDSSHCLSLGILSNVEDCYIPCPDACVVSEWSEWTECSETCGSTVGNQSRQREFLAMGTPCPFTVSNLTETRNCSSPQPCEEDIYHIIEDPWEMCISDDTSSVVECGMGVQNRTSVCMKGGNAIPPEECPIPFEEMQQQACELPCPCQYTEWTSWSNCSVTCGSGVRTRSRRLLRFSDTDPDCSFEGEIIDGFQTETEPCQISSSCQQYAWYLYDYGECTPFPSISTASSSGSASPCGYGYQNRSVQCHNSVGGQVVEDNLCLGFGEEKPGEFQSCVVPCEDSCIVEEWSDFTPCSADEDQTRSRDIVPCTSHGDVNGCCPKLLSLQLSETIPCNRLDLTRYNLRVTGHYGECIVNNNGTCGNGYEYAPYACYNTQTNTVVPDDYCSLPSSREVRVPLERQCTVQCDTNCELYDWSDWGPCTVTCGRGTRTRTREVKRQPDNVGRPCGALSETEICEDVSCPYAEFVPGPFSTCVLNDSNSTCGMGMKTREAICLVNGQTADSMDCLQLSAVVTFDFNFTCTMPCPGECVVGKWGEWSQCSCGSDGSCQQTRRREILRPDISCSSMLVEYRTCQVYTWRASTEWTDCVLPEIMPGETHPNFYCGNGTQNRDIDCINNRTAEVVHDFFCESIPRPAQIQSCNITCPVDCQVGDFSEWSVTLESFDDDMPRCVQTRQRKILISPSFGGRQCPALTQEKPCPVNWYKYVYESREPRCLVDYSSETQCGSALQSQPISCRRNDMFVQPSECLEAARQGLAVEGLTNPDVDLSAITYCEISCPREAECSFTEWSSPSDCMTSCYDRESPFAFRSRALIRSFEKNTSTCLASQHELLNCLSTVETPSNTTTTTTPLSVVGEMGCVALSWQVSQWENDDTREIRCETSDGIRVTGGCPLSLRPLTDRYPCLSTVCPDYSTCNSSSGLCQCSSLSEKVEGECLPLSGCFEDDHCLIPNMQCDEMDQVCVCSPSYELQDGVCTYVPTTRPPTTTSEPTFPTTTPLDSSTSMASSATTSAAATNLVTTVDDSGADGTTALGILEIVLIGTVPLVVVIITVLVLILITYRCRVYLEKEHEETKRRRRATLSISSPSPAPQTAEEMMARLSRRGAESASSGFVDDLDNELQKYGMPGNSFLVSQHSKHSEDIDEAVFSTPNHVPRNPIPVPAPVIPVSNPLHNINDSHQHHPSDLASESNLDGRVLNHQIVPGTPYTLADNYPDGDFTTDVTYTTDEGSIIGTSVPPSSMGSPSIMRRGEDIPRHLQQSPDRFQRSASHGTENQYVDMQAQHVYASIKRGGGRRHDYQHHHPQQEHPRDYRSVKAYERQSRERSERSHDQSRETSHDYLSEPDYARSITPTSPTARYPPSFTTPHSPSHISSRDCRIATGLDNSIVRAAAQVTDEQGHNSQDDYEFQRSHNRSSGGRRSHRRSSRRRRRHQQNHSHGNNPHHMTYHPSSHHDDYHYYHHDDGRYPPPPRVARHYSEGDHDNYYYHSDHDTQAVYPAPTPPHYYPPSRSVPMTPTIPPGHQIPPHHHPHSPAVVHGHPPPHSPAIAHRQQYPPPHSPALIQGHPPPHTPSSVRQPYSHVELHQPNIEVQPPTPANSRREHNVPSTPHSLHSRESPYIPTATPHQQTYQPHPHEEHQQQNGYIPQGSVYPQSSSTPNLPTHVIPQPPPHSNAPPLPSGGDSYDNYDFPRRVHAHYTRQEQLRQAADTPDSSHYAYPRSVLSSMSGVPSPIPSSSQHTTADHHHHQPNGHIVANTDPPQSSTVAMATSPYAKSASLRSDVSTASSATTYAPQSIVSDSATTNSQPASPYVVRRQHHPSPLVLHSSSSNSPATSSVYTPRGSAEVQQQLNNLSDTLSFESPAANPTAIGNENHNHGSSFDSQQLQPTAHTQYQLHHRLQNGAPMVTQQ